MDSPFFSIIIPTYNRAAFIEKTIASVLKQDFEDFELIIVDDGSTDNTDEVVSKIQDNRIRYFKKKNAERGAARNYGAKKSRGKYLNFLDSDDKLYPNHLSTAYNLIQEKSPLLFALHYDLEVCGKKTSADYLPLSRIINEALIKVGNFISCNAVFISNEVFKKEQFKEIRELSGSEDYELWLRLAARYPFYYYPEITSTIVFHESRSVVSMPTDQLIRRKELMLSEILEDKVFLEQYDKFRKYLISNTNSYLALHLALKGLKLKSIKYLWRAFKANPASLFRKRSLAIIKRLFF